MHRKSELDTIGVLGEPVAVEPPEGVYTHIYIYIYTHTYGEPEAMRYLSLTIHLVRDWTPGSGGECSETSFYGLGTG